MKLDIQVEKIVGFLKSKRNFFIKTCLFLLMLAMAVGTYFVLVPAKDKTVAKDAEKKLLELNISFNKKSLQELNNKKSPAVINETGGRNPFMPY